MMSHKIQIDDEIRNATPEEAAFLDEWRASEEARVRAKETVAAAKASARTKLKALGLTDAEIAALVG